MEKEEFDNRLAFLKQYQERQREIIGHTYELERWGGIGTTINQKYQEGFGSSGENTSKPELAGVNITHVTAQIQADIDKAKEERDKVKKAVEKVKKKRYRDVLRFKFINGMKNKAIAELTETTERNIYKVIKKAVEYVEIEDKPG